jgi:uncharacterized protein
MDNVQKGKLALITGASSGIGAATARKLAREGLYTVLVARRRERLEDVASEIRQAGGEADIIEADLTYETGRVSAFEQATRNHENIDILINNAGLGWYGFGAEMPWKTALEMLQVNISAVVHFTLLALQKMRERNTGHIVNIGSISGSLPSQGIALYGATKTFLDNFTPALYRELRGTHVNISVVRAGPVLTEFCEAAAERPFGLAMPTARMGVTAETVAERIWKLLQHPKRVAYIPPLLAFTPWVEAYFGWLIDHLGPLLLRRKTHI